VADVAAAAVDRYRMSLGAAIPAVSGETPHSFTRRWHLAQRSARDQRRHRKRSCGFSVRTIYGRGR